MNGAHRKDHESSANVGTQEELDTSAYVDLSRPKHAGANRLWWQIILLVAVSFLAVYSGTAYDEELKKFVPEARQMASVFNKRPSGLKGVYRLAESLGLKVAAWEHPYRQLKNTNGMLVIIAPLESLQPFEIEQILDWVKDGNELVYIDDMSFSLSNQFANSLGLTIKMPKSASDSSKEDVDLKPIGKGKELARVSNLKLAGSARVKGGTAVAADKEGAFLTVVPYGQGRVLFGTCPAILANSSIAKREYWGNFQYFANWFRTASGTIYFDEYCHGFSGGTNIFVYLARTPLGPVCAQILLILAIAVISESQRFGAPRVVDKRRRISNLEFIDGLSNAYRRAKANPAVLEIIFHSFKNKLSRALGVSPHEPVERLSEAWSDSKFQTGFSLDTLLKQYEDFMSRRHVSDAELKNLVESCDKITETASKDSLPTRAMTHSKSFP